MLDTYNETPDYFNEEQLDKEKTLEELHEEAIETLQAMVKVQTERLNYKIVQLKKLAEIERDLATFGTITHEQLLLKREILNQYE